MNDYLTLLRGSVNSRPLLAWRNTGHFAENKSPWRERRLVWFAGNDETEGPENPNEPVGPRGPEDQEGDNVSETQESTATRIHALNTPPSIEGLTESPRLWNQMGAIAWSDDEKRRLRAAIERAGIVIQSDAELIDILTRSPAAGNIDTLQSEVLRVMIEDPSMQLKVVTQLQGRVSFFDGLHRLLEAELPADFAEREELLKNREVAEALERKSALLIAQGKDIGEWFANAPIAEIIQELDMDKDAPVIEKDRPGIVTRGLRLLSQKLKKYSYGSGTWGPSVPDEENHTDRNKAQNEYINALRNEANTLKENVHYHIRARSAAAAKGAIDQYNQLAKEPYQGMNMAEANKNFKEQHGVSINGFEKEVDHTLTLRNRTDAQMREKVRKQSQNDALSDDDRKGYAANFANLERDALPEASHPQFTELARGFLDDLQYHESESPLERVKRAQEELDEWREENSSAIAAALDRLKEQKVRDAVIAFFHPHGEEFIEALEQTRGAYTDEALSSSEVLDVSDTRINRESLMQVIGFINANTVEELEPITQQESSQDTAELTGETETLRASLEGMKDSIEKIRSVRACEVTGIAEKIISERGRVHEALEYLPYRLESTDSEEASSAQAELNVLRTTTEKLAIIADYLDSPPQTQYYNDPKDKGNGYFDYQSKTIYINEATCTTPQTLERAEEHERGHALIHLLTHDTRLIPAAAIFDPIYEELANNPTHGENFAKALDEAAETWGLQNQYHVILEYTLKKYGVAPTETDTTNPLYRKAVNEAKDLYRNKQMEELLLTYMTMQQKGEEDSAYSRFADVQYSAAEQQLFTIIEELEPAPATTLTALERGREEELILRMKTDTAPNPKENQEENLIGTNVQVLMEDIDMFIKSLDEFSALPGFANDVKILKPQLAEAKRRYDIMRKTFQTQKDHSVDPPVPLSHDAELNDAFVSEVKKLRDDLDSRMKEVVHLMEIEHDPTKTRIQKKGLWHRLRYETVYLSLHDLYLIGKEATEDLKRLWTRRGELGRSQLGEAITQLIPDAAPYVGKLKYEFDRRRERSEQAEVQEWEDALKTKGANELIESIRNIGPGEKDRMKAIMIRLQGLGRIDWDNEEVWKSLNRLSNVSMPIAAARYNRFTRDKWLQRLVYDIWNDPDLFNTWKSGNEGTFTSKRNEYESYADVRSNSGRERMQQELSHQLKTFVQCKRDRRPLPDNVNPHVYEELLYYAMYNGKMSMEDKFFYLIQGIDSGFLPLDRLNILNAQVLSQFPFIDFFSNKNNTRTEIASIAKLLREEEDKNSKERYEPGLKTKVWLELALGRSEETRQRAVKVLSRAGDGIDHEDIPMLMAFLELGDLNELLSVQRGQQQRVTQEGLKNAYVGYGTFNGTYANLAKLSLQQNDEGNFTSSFTRHDAENFISKLVAYTHFDNIMNDAADDGNRRPKLSKHKINNETMPSGGSKKTKEFRNPLNTLAAEIFTSYGIAEAENIRGGKEGEPAETVTVDDYLSARRDRNEQWQPREKITKHHIFNASAIFVEKLTKAVLENPKQLIEALGRERAESERILNEGKELTTDAVQEVLHSIQGSTGQVQQAA